MRRIIMKNSIYKLITSLISSLFFSFAITACSGGGGGGGTTPDTTAPTVIIDSIITGPTNNSPIPITVTFSESVEEFDLTDVTIANGIGGNFSGSGDTYTLDVIPIADGTVTIDIYADVAEDAAGNGNEAATQFSIDYDGTSPDPVISCDQDPGPTNVDPLSFEVDFGEVVSGFIATDISISSGSIQNFSDDGSGLYSFEVTGMTSGADLTVDIPSSVCSDGVGNSNVAATQYSIHFDNDSVTPIISSTESSPSNADPLPISVSFGEAVTGFVSGDISLSSGSVINFTDDGGGDFSFDVTGMTDGQNLTIDINAGVCTDLALNSNLAATQFVIFYDGTAPTILSISSSTLNGSYRSGSSINITVTFSEAVSLSGGNLNVYLDTGDIIGITPFSSMLSPTATYTVGAGDNSIDLDAVNIIKAGGATLMDAAGNAATVALPATTIADLKDIIVDSTDPTITSITSATADGSYKSGESIDVTVNFSEAVTLSSGSLNVTLDTGDIITISPFGSSTSASGTYIVSAADSSSDLDATNIALVGGQLRDAALNNTVVSLPANTIADLKSIVIDTTAPSISSITSSTADGIYNPGDDIDITVNFSENVTLSGGNLNVTLDTGDIISITPFSNASSASATYTVAAPDTSTDLDSTNIALSAGTLQDAAGNDTPITLPASTIADTEDIVIDTSEPTITSITSSTSDGYYKEGENIDITINFSEEVTLAGGNLEITLDTGDVISIATISSATTASGTYTIGAGDNSADLNATLAALSAGTLQDSAGNDTDLTLPAAGSLIIGLKDIVVDTTAPVINNITSSSADGYYSAGAAVDVTVTFSEPVTLTGDTLDVTIDANVGNPIVSISPFTADATPNASYTVQAGDSSADLDSTAIALGVSGTLEDLAGNAATVSLPTNTIADLHDIIVDATLPNITSITSSTSDGTYGETSNINVTVNFSEAVTLSGGNLVVTLDTGGTATILDTTCTTATSCSATYTVGPGEDSNDLDAAGISLSAGTLRDAALNDVAIGLPATTIADGSDIIVDTTAPTITSISSSTSDGYYTSGAGINVTVNFSENVTLAGGNLEVTLDTGDTISITPFSDSNTASATYSVGAGDNSTDLDSTGINLQGGATLQDEAGNDTTISLPATVIATGSDIVVDTTVPTITSITSSTADGTYKIYDNINVTVNFSENVTLSGGNIEVTLDTTDVVSISTCTDSSSCSGTYTVGSDDVTTDLDSTSISLSAGTLQDAAGNNATVALPATNIADGSSIVIDGVIPSVTSAQTMDADGDGKIDHYKITFNKSMVDATFPGYNGGSDTGNPQTDWLVSGYINVKMVRNTAAPEADTADDEVIYLKFNEDTNLDSDAKPDLTTTSTPQLQDAVGNTLSQVQTADVAEVDCARPIICFCFWCNRFKYHFSQF
jgi:hypothetical protein